MHLRMVARCDYAERDEENSPHPEAGRTRPKATAGQEGPTARKNPPKQLNPAKATQPSTLKRKVTSQPAAPSIPANTRIPINVIIRRRLSHDSYDNAPLASSQQDDTRFMRGESPVSPLHRRQADEGPLPPMSFALHFAGVRDIRATNEHNADNPPPRMGPTDMNRGGRLWTSAKRSRHGTPVRRYTDRPIDDVVAEQLVGHRRRPTLASGLSISSSATEPGAFSNVLKCYGRFHNVSNYLAFVSAGGAIRTSSGLLRRRHRAARPAARSQLMLGGWNLRSQAHRLSHEPGRTTRAGSSPRLRRGPGQPSQEPYE